MACQRATLAEASIQALHKRPHFATSRPGQGIRATAVGSACALLSVFVSRLDAGSKCMPLLTPIQATSTTAATSKLACCTAGKRSEQGLPSYHVLITISRCESQ